MNFVNFVQQQKMFTHKTRYLLRTLFYFNILYKKMPDQKAFIATMKMCESFQVEADPLLLLRACLK